MEEAFGNEVQANARDHPGKAVTVFATAIFVKELSAVAAGGSGVKCYTNNTAVYKDLRKFLKGLQTIDPSKWTLSKNEKRCREMQISVMMLLSSGVM